MAAAILSFLVVIFGHIQSQVETVRNILCLCSSFTWSRIALARALDNGAVRPRAQMQSPFTWQDTERIITLLYSSSQSHCPAVVRYFFVPSTTTASIIGGMDMDMLNISGVPDYPLSISRRVCRLHCALNAKASDQSAARSTRRSDITRMRLAEKNSFFEVSSLVYLEQ